MYMMVQCTTFDELDVSNPTTITQAETLTLTFRLPAILNSREKFEYL